VGGVRTKGGEQLSIKTIREVLGRGEGSSGPVPELSEREEECNTANEFLRGRKKT